VLFKAAAHEVPEGTSETFPALEHMVLRSTTLAWLGCLFEHLVLQIECYFFIFILFISLGKIGELLTDCASFFVWIMSSYVGANLSIALPAVLVSNF
jgi:hypothetical protein